MAFPPDSPRFEADASVTLLTLNLKSGAISKIADYIFKARCPRAGTFDLTGDRRVPLVVCHLLSLSAGQIARAAELGHRSGPSLKRATTRGRSAFAATFSSALGSHDDGVRRVSPTLL